MELRDVTNSFITIESLKDKESGSFNGLTFGIKDNIPVKGMRCTSGSRLFLDNFPEKHSRVVQSILFNGGEIAGKTNLHELGIGATGTSSIMGPSRNPHDFNRISGGSSGGSASAVASGLVDVGIGTDTGGSVRIPAALCGVIGYKPSNMYSKSDAEIPFSPILETTGIMTRDLTTLQWVVRDLFPNIEEMDFPNDKIRLGILGESRDANFEKLTAMFRAPGSHVEAEQVSIPLLETEGNSIRMTIAARDGYEALKEKLKANACDFHPDVRAVLESGEKIEKSDYNRMLSARKDVIAQYNEVMYDYDAVISPTTSIVAPRIMDVLGKEAKYRDSLIRNPELFNVLAAPSITIPSGKLEGMPTGLMISGGPGDDSKLLRISEALSKIIQKVV